MTHKNKILLAGAGYMAKEYAKILKDMNISFVVVGRSEKSAEDFKKETGIDCQKGGISNWLKTNPVPKLAIVAVTGDQLGTVSRVLIKAGCKELLVEKPGGLDGKDIKNTANLAKKNGAHVYIAYNRRFYSSVLKALEIIKQDGGVNSFDFDFTERSYQIENLPQMDKIKKEWFLHNSTHVIDMAFFIGGWPQKLISYREGTLKWHPAGAIYSGAGISNTEAVFSYHANWLSAGRWGIEVMTPKNKLIFRPLEKLQIQRYGNMNIEDVPLDNQLDIDFKPGIYRQVDAFLNSPGKLLTIKEHVKNLKTFSKIHGGHI